MARSAPYYFVTVPEDEAQALHDVAHVSYGWGMIPVTARIGRHQVDDVAVAQGRRLRRAAQGRRPSRRGRPRRATPSRWGWTSAPSRDLWRLTVGRTDRADSDSTRPQPDSPLNPTRLDSTQNAATIRGRAP